MSKVSVVVPVYNDKEYLTECVDSIRAQRDCDIEIVLVDDGSNDGSEELCDHLSDKYSNVKTIHQSNKGQNAARERGVSEASGEYVGFVDADDWIEPDMYSFLLNGIREADLITSGVFLHGSDGKKSEIWHDNLVSGVYSVWDDIFQENLFMSRYYDGVSGMPGALLNNLVCKLFRKDLLKLVLTELDVRITYREDLLVLLLYLFRSDKVIVTDGCYYHYRHNVKSITHTANSEFLYDRANEYSVLINEIRKNDKNSFLEHQFKRRFLYDFLPLMFDQLEIPISLSYPIFSFSDERIIGKRIALFGAGKVGSSYYSNWLLNSTVDVVRWVDNTKIGEKLFAREIERPDVLLESDFDFVVCAVFDEHQAISIKTQLADYSIPEEKILWEKPKDIWRGFYSVWAGQ